MTWIQSVVQCKNCPAIFQYSELENTEILQTSFTGSTLDKCAPKGFYKKCFHKLTERKQKLNQVKFFIFIES